MGHDPTPSEIYREALVAARERSERSPFAAAVRLRLLALAGILAGPGLPLLILAVGTTVALPWITKVANGAAWDSSAATNLWTIGLITLAIAGVTAVKSWRFVERIGILPLTREDAPALFDALDRLRPVAKAPRINDVGIALGVLASVETLPIFGPWSPTRKRLILGVPLLACLDPQHTEAVILHELAHISRRAPSPPAWVCWSVAYWQRRFQSAQTQPGNSLIGRMVLQLAAAADASRHAGENFADKLAADHVGAQVIGDALIHTAIEALFEERVFWPRLEQQQGQRSVPPNMAISQLVTAIEAGEAYQSGLPLLTSSLLDPTLDDDSHPSLLDRLQRVGWLKQAEARDQNAAVEKVVSRVPQPPAGSAWTAWFSSTTRQRLLAVLDRVFQDGIAPQWQAAHGDTLYARDALERDRDLASQLNGQIPLLDGAVLGENGPVRGPISAEPNDLNRTADLIGRALPGEAAIPLLRMLLEVNENLPSAHFHLGRALNAQGDPDCLFHLDRAAELSPVLAVSALELAFIRRRQLGRRDEAEATRSRGEKALAELQAFEQRQTTAPARDAFAEHRLSPLALSRLHRDLASYPFIREAYLVRRPDVRLGNVESHALFVRLAYPWYRPVSESHFFQVETGLAHGLDLHEPVTVMVLNRQGAKRFEKLVRGVKGSLIYRGR